MIVEHAPDIRVEFLARWPERPTDPSTYPEDFTPGGRRKRWEADVGFLCECGIVHRHGGVVDKDNKLVADPGWRVSHCALWPKGYNLVACEREARRA
jgi:hypothetical protein